MLKSELTLGLIGVVVVIGLLLYLKNAANAEGVAHGLVTTAGGIATGTVYGIGDTVGVPRTDPTQCQLDLERGDMWAASFSCDAGTYLSAVKDKVFG